MIHISTSRFWSTPTALPGVLRSRKTLLLIIFFCLVSPAFSADKGDVVVGVKPFTEGIIISQMSAQLAQTAGVTVHTSELSGSGIWTALLTGKVDLYPDYTGTIIQFGLKDPSIQTHKDLVEALARQGLGVTESLGFNDTYALGMTEARADQLNIKSISDLAAHPELQLGFSNEFKERVADGWPGLKSAYGLPQNNPQGLQHDLAYRGLVGNKIDLTDFYSTDAEIQQYHLRVLTDDLHFFPDYQAVILYRLDLKKRVPAVIAAIEKLQGKIDEATMRRLNTQAKIGKVPEGQVAANFLSTALGVKSTFIRESLARRIFGWTIEHLKLVTVSLLAAIVIAVPVGVAAAEFPAFGRIAIAVVAAIYTVPSLALLAFMISFLPTGFIPAVIALFLYSLLPIVRNTQAGLDAIPHQTRESARVLGLSNASRLLKVEIPMALPAILAGIKTAAVLNVGTATLGALIGAGGYGQPIISGINIDSKTLIFAGAIPAAVMALLVQGGFDLLERWVTPRGLRVKRDGVR